MKSVIEIVLETGIESCMRPEMSEYMMNETQWLTINDPGDSFSTKKF